jgi:hypothetical protein
MKSEIEITSDVLRALRLKLDGLLPESLQKSQVFVDLVDIHEICRAYLNAVNRILVEESLSPAGLEDILYEIDSELFEHLPYHLKSLKKLLPKVIEALENQQAIGSG